MERANRLGQGAFLRRWPQPDHGATAAEAGHAGAIRFRAEADGEDAPPQRGHRVQRTRRPDYAADIQAVPGNPWSGRHAVLQLLHRRWTRHCRQVRHRGATAFNEPGALITPQIFKLYREILGAEDTPFYSFFIADGRGIVDKCGIEGPPPSTNPAP